MIEFVPTNMAHGGAAIGRVDGKAHFVDGAMPGERVRGEIVQDKKAWARVMLDEVVEESPLRVSPPCRHFELCGGCQWQFADYSAQLEWKQSIVAGQLGNLGGLVDPPVGQTVAPGPEYGYRNRMDFSVQDGAPALTQRKSHTLVPIAECLLLTPALVGVFENLKDLGEARSVTLRSSTVSGEILAVIRGPVPDGAADWGCLVSRRDRTGVHPVIGSGEIHETVAGANLRITGDAFFQTNTPGAETLVALVGEALEPQAGETLLDAYAGGGLFSVTVGRTAGAVIAVEANGLGVFDLRHNLSEVGIDQGGEELSRRVLHRRGLGCCRSRSPQRGATRARSSGRYGRRTSRHRLCLLRSSLIGQGCWPHGRCGVSAGSGDPGRPVPADLPHRDGGAVCPQVSHRPQAVGEANSHR